MYIVTMSSEEFGSEDFTYDTRAEAEAGRARLEREVDKLADGIERYFRLYKPVGGRHD